jgi:Ca2+-binding RTX toxin-like protein
MATNFKSLFTKSNRAKRTQLRRSSLQPRFESLEDRRMMTADIWTTAPGADGTIDVVAVGTTGADQITVNSYTATQQIAGPRGMRTIQVPMIEVRISDAGGSQRLDAAGNPLVRSFEQAKVSELRFFGDSGDDTITNNSSIPSYMYGEGGNDSLFGGSGADRIYGDSDASTGVGQDKLYGRDGNDHLSGGALNDELWGGFGKDILYGDGGHDNLSGEAGDDHLFGGPGNDNLIGGLNNDELWGGYGDDILSGNSGNDLLVGEFGSDRLFGGSDDDILMGGHRHLSVQNAVRNAELGTDTPIYTQYDDGNADHLWGGEGLDDYHFNVWSDWIDGVFQTSGYAPDGVGASAKFIQR